ncbi:MAG: glycosyltransferase [candidate division Zixibacteria bacterium]|nr:glycosyltransferase [candidate division Zixibacteria bacterium]
MKLGIITNRYPAGREDTASPFVKDFVHALRERGIKVSVFTPEYVVDGPDNDPKVFRFPWSGSAIPIGSLDYRSPVNWLKLASFLYGGRKAAMPFVITHDVDYLLALWALPSGYFARYISQRTGVPYSVWCLGSDVYKWSQRPFFGHLTRQVLLGADHLFGDGFDLCWKVEELSGRECRFLPSARRREKRSILPKTGYNRFFYLGRLEREKGVEDMLLAFSYVSKKKSAVLEIAGWGSLASEIPRRMAELKIGEKANFLGKISEKEASERLRRASCVLIPSHSDSIPLVLTEAVASGTPVIATDVGDLGYLVRKFNLGKVVPPHDPKNLAQAMFDFIQEKRNYDPAASGLLDLLDVNRAAGDFLKVIAGKRSGPPLRRQMANLFD